MMKVDGFVPNEPSSRGRAAGYIMQLEYLCTDERGRTVGGLDPELLKKNDAGDRSHVLLAIYTS